MRNSARHVEIASAPKCLPQARRDWSHARCRASILLHSCTSKSTEPSVRQAFCPKTPRLERRVAARAPVEPLFVARSQGAVQGPGSCDESSLETFPELRVVIHGVLSSLAVRAVMSASRFIPRCASAAIAAGVSRTLVVPSPLEIHLRGHNPKRPLQSHRAHKMTSWRELALRQAQRRRLSMPTLPPLKEKGPTTRRVICRIELVSYPAKIERISRREQVSCDADLPT